MTNSTHRQTKLNKINLTKTIVIVSDISLVYRYKLNHIYQFTKDLRCFNVITEKELHLVSPNRGRCFGYCLDGKFKSLTFIRKNIEKILVIRNRITDKDIFSAVMQHYKVTEADLKGMKKDRGLDVARTMLAMLLDYYVTNNNILVARLMNRKSASTTFELVENGRALFESNVAFRNNYNLIEEILKSK